MRLLNLIIANSRKEYIELKRYLPNTISMLLTFYFVFLAMFFGITLIGDPSTMEENIQYVIVSYIFWFFSMMAIQGLGWVIMSEAQRGTLEQLYMSPMGVWKIMISRMISVVTMNFFMIILLLLASMATARTWLNLDLLTILPIFIPTLVSMFGVGFMVAGLSIILKQINGFLQILQFVFMGLTFVPISTAPYLAFAPFVLGVDLIRRIMVHGLSFTAIPFTDLLLLGTNAIFYFLFGLLVFLRCEKYAMEKGLLGHY